jgi:hypothetical protein
MTKKTIKIFTLLFLISIFIFSITGCSSNSEDALSSSKSYNVNFAVTDENEDAVAAANLTLAGEKKPTDAGGLVSFKKVNGKYDYELSAVGYSAVFDSIVVNGEDTTKQVELSLTPGDSDPGDTDNTIDPDDPDDKDTTAPVLTSLYAWIDGDFYGLNVGLIKEFIDENEKFDDNYDYFILYFSENVVKDEDFDLEKDFKVQLISVNPKEDLTIDNAFLNSAFLVLKIDENIILDNYEGFVGVTISDGGRQKIVDLSGNMLSETPETVELKI